MAGRTEVKESASWCSIVQHPGRRRDWHTECQGKRGETERNASCNSLKWLSALFRFRPSGWPHDHGTSWSGEGSGHLGAMSPGATTYSTSSYRSQEIPFGPLGGLRADCTSLNILNRLHLYNFVCATNESGGVARTVDWPDNLPTSWTLAVKAFRVLCNPCADQPISPHHLRRRQYGVQSLHNPTPIILMPSLTHRQQLPILLLVG